MKILIQTTLSGLKPVISGFLLLGSIFVGQCQCQTERDDKELVNIVIDKTISQENGYWLNETPSKLNDKLKKYYEAKYLGKSSFGRIMVYDEEKDTLYTPKERQKERDSIMLSKYKALDSLFSKKDVEYMLTLRPDKKWDTSFFENQDYIKIRKKKEGKNDFSGNYVSWPYYSSDGTRAIVGHYSMKRHSTFFIFKMKDDKWELVSQIENIW